MTLSDMIESESDSDMINLLFNCPGKTILSLFTFFCV